MTTRSVDFRSMVARRRDACVKFKDGAPARNRREALQFYRGDNLDVYGDSGDGLSTVVSRDTMEAIEGIMPPLIRPFVAGEEVVNFDPVGAEDEEGAKQCTEYVNHVFRRHNNVLQVTQTGLKDGLLFRLGVAKTVMEEVEEGGPQRFDGLTIDQVTAMRMELAQAGLDTVGDIEQDPETLLFSVVAPPRRVKKFRVHIIAPDEFLYEERLASLKEATFLGHAKTMTVADLIDLGVPEKDALSLSSGEPTEEQDERFKGEDDAGEWEGDDLARPVRVDECYIKCNYGGQGELEWRRVLLGGSSSKMLLDEPVDDHPYSTWTPVPVPHKLAGLSMHDLTRDVQINKTAIQREINNALYLANRPMREVVDGEVNIDDVLNPRVGGFVRVKRPGMINAMPSGGEAAMGAGFQAIEYFDGVREARTGVTRYNQGMDSSSLNKTATGMNIIASNSQQRQELIARQFGEFLKDIFEKMLSLVIDHASEEDVIKLRGQFVPWPTEYDTNVSVGLGTNNKDQLVGHFMQMMQLDREIIQLQGGLNGPLLTAPNIYEKLKGLTEAMGMKGIDRYYTNPAEAPPPPEAEGEDPLAETRLEIEGDLAQEQMRQEGAMAREQLKQQPDVVPFPVAL